MNQGNIESFKNAVKFHRAGLSPKMRTRVPKSPTMLYPSAIERQYSVFISSILNRFIDYTNNIIKPKIERWLKERQAQTDSITDAEDWSEDLNQNVQDLQNIDTQTFERDKLALEKEIAGIAILVSIFHQKQHFKIVQSVTGVVPYIPEPWWNSDMNSWIRENTSLIRKLSQEYINEINRIVNNGIRNGTSVQDLWNQIAKVNDKVKGYRSRLIARDQIGKFYGELSQKRQESIGLDWYIWATTRDERVRPKHRLLDGKLCRWDDSTVYSDDGGKTWKSRADIGAYIGIPGSDFQCRCYSRPYFKKFFKELDKEM